MLEWIRDHPAEAVILSVLIGWILSIPGGIISSLLTQPLKDWWLRSNFQTIQKRLFERQTRLDKLTRCHEDSAVLQAELVSAGLSMLLALLIGVMLTLLN